MTFRHLCFQLNGRMTLVRAAVEAANAAPVSVPRDGARRRTTCRAT